jgi:hypothetical protein
VKAADAYAVWVSRHEPTAEEKGFVVHWLAEREASGPPNDAHVDSRGNWTASAGGQEFYFRVEELTGEDPVGYIFIMRIT